MRERLETLLQGRGRNVGAVVVPGVIFGLVLAGIVIDQPLAFGGYVVAVALGLVLLGRAGVIAPLREVTRGSLGRAVSFVLILVFPFTQLNNPLWIRVAGLGAIFAALALGLNIVVGRAGLLDLGYAAFFGIGAFTGAMLSDCARCPMQHHLPWLLALLISGLFGAVFGVLLGTPVLRLRGDYLAIVTLGFGEIVRIALNNLDDVPILHTNLTNGPNGLFGVGNPKIGPLDFGSAIDIFGVEVPNVIKYYFLALALMLVIVFVVRRMDSSRIGRAWTAIREDEQAAQAMGINTTRAKLLAFATGAFFGGVAGNIFVHFQSGTSPDDFSFIISVTVLAMVVLGGMGNATGVALGAVLLIALPEKLRFVSDYRFLLFGAILMVMMRFRPEGLIPEQRRRRELSEQKEDG
jgi:branched-chain amino acid transport system permease protein